MKIYEMKILRDVIVQQGTGGNESRSHVALTYQSERHRQDQTKKNRQRFKKNRILCNEGGALMPTAGLEQRMNRRDRCWS